MVPHLVYFTLTFSTLNYLIPMSVPALHAFLLHTERSLII